MARSRRRAESPESVAIRPIANAAPAGAAHCNGSEEVMLVMLP